MTVRVESGALYLPDESATESAGSALAGGAETLISSWRSALMVYLRGDLGAGKTCLVRGVMRRLGHAGAVKSPTYTLLEPYERTRVPVCHFDLYRLSDPGEVEFLGVEDCFGSGHLCLVEWPDRGAGRMPAADLEIELEIAHSGRVLHWRSGTAAGHRLGATLLQAGAAGTGGMTAKTT